MSIYGYIRLNNHRRNPENFDLKKQASLVKNWAGKNGYDIKKIFREIESTSTSLELPKLKKLITLIKRGEVDVLIVARLDRLTRRIRLYQKMLKLFEEYKKFYAQLYISKEYRLKIELEKKNKMIDESKVANYDALFRKSF